MFKKAFRSAGKMFKKGLSTATNVSKSLGGASHLLSGVANTARKIIDNPIVRTTALALAPEVAVPALAGLEAATRLAQVGAKGLHQASTITNPATYKPITGGSVPQNAQNVASNIQTGLQKAKDLGQTAQQAYTFVK